MYRTKFFTTQTTRDCISSETARLIGRDNGAVIIPETEIKILIAATKPDPLCRPLHSPLFRFRFAAVSWPGWIKIRSTILLLFTAKN